MIRHPKPGQAVRVHYAKRYAHTMPLHGRVGVVRVVSKGPGPRNHGIEIDGKQYGVPAGNLMPHSQEN